MISSLSRLICLPKRSLQQALLQVLGGISSELSRLRLTDLPTQLLGQTLRELNGISSELPVHDVETGRPLLFFVRGTLASVGFPLHISHLVLYEYIEVLTGVEVVDVRLVNNGLRDGTREMEAAFEFIEARHQAEPDRLCMIAGWSRGAIVAAEAAMEFPWLCGLFQYVPPNQGSWVSHPLIPGTLGEYGQQHPNIREYYRRLLVWLDSPQAVPMSILFAEDDFLIRPCRGACVDHSQVRNVPIAGWLWNHGTLPFATVSMLELCMFIERVHGAESALRETPEAPLRHLGAVRAA